MLLEPGLRIVNTTLGAVVADHVEVASSFWARGKGLIGRRELPDGFGLVLKPCGSIHMFFMSIPLDVVHVDRHGRIVKILHEIKPWRAGPIVLRGKWVVELPAGVAAATGLQVGDSVELRHDAVSSPS